MTHWTPQQPHLSEVLFSLYLLAIEQLEKAVLRQIFFGTFFAKIAIIRTTKGKD
jgi:hypothetical protein